MGSGAAVVLVAVDAGKDITDYALEWTIRNVVQPSDTLILLALIKSFPNSARPLQAHGSFNRFKQPSLLTSVLKWSQSTERARRKGLVDEGAIKKINDVCGEMMNELCWVNNLNGLKTHVVVTVIPGAHMGYVADKAKEYKTNWLILDRQLKKESKSCLNQLEDCNIILIDHAIPKILRIIEASDTEESNNNYTVTFPMHQSNDSVTDNSTSITSNSSYTMSGPHESTTSNSSYIMSDPHELSTEIDTGYKFSQKAKRINSTTSNSSYIMSGPHELSTEIDTRYIFSQKSKRIEYESDSWPKPTLILTRGTRTEHLPHGSPIQHLKLKDSSERMLSPLGRQRPDSRCSESSSESKSPQSHQMRRQVVDDEIYTSWSPDSTNSDISAANREVIKVSLPTIATPRDYSHSAQREYSHSAPSHYSNTNAMSELSINEWMFGNHAIQIKGGALKPSTLGRRLEDTPSTLNPKTLKKTPTVDRISSVRRAISLSIKQPLPPPPLCSVCRHRAPTFGKPPKKFSYEEVEKATDGFAQENFLAEGGYGVVFRGVLEDGQVVAVKQHKKVSAQGAAEFCAEVEVLSCAQHRNLVMLVGYCMDRDWLLIYEFVCNGSVDKHLQGVNNKGVMAWHHRQKVAVGAARALRYLHEDCRVGCIIHRDFRPNNILLTHDFEPMVGDFGLARWQEDGQKAEETRIVGSFGYLAPEYTQTGQITEKADVYAFGMLLLELISGVKAIDLAKCTGSQTLPRWVRTLIEKNLLYGLMDPRLNENYNEQEAECMIYVASLCISQHSELRPRMSKVLRMLEGDMPSEGVSPKKLQMSVKPISPLRVNSGPVESFRNQVDQTTSFRNRADQTMYHLLYECSDDATYDELKRRRGSQIAERNPKGRMS